MAVDKRDLEGDELVRSRERAGEQKSKVTGDASHYEPCSLLPAIPVVTFPAAEQQRPLIVAKLYCLVTG